MEIKSDKRIYLESFLSYQQNQSKTNASHCARPTEEITNKLVLWEPADGIANRGGRQLSYIDNLMNVTGVDNIKELMTIIYTMAYKPP